MDSDRSDRWPRRKLLATLGAAGAVGLAGCGSLPGTGQETSGATATEVPEQLSPPQRGESDAGVTVTVYADFACPHCKNFHDEFQPQITEQYVSEGVAVYEHRDFPIPVDDPESYRAANAARAVQDSQGDDAFFEFADGLFANRDSLGLDLYGQLAGEVDADAEAVRQAAEDRIYAQTVQGDRQRGNEQGVSGTPAVFVDGEQVDELTWDAISGAIESASEDS